MLFIWFLNLMKIILLKELERFFGSVALSVEVNGIKKIFSVSVESFIKDAFPFLWMDIHIR